MSRNKTKLNASLYPDQTSGRFGVAYVDADNGVLVIEDNERGVIAEVSATELELLLRHELTK